jgi:hypothetical protein
MREMVHGRGLVLLAGLTLAGCGGDEAPRTAGSEGEGNAGEVAGAPMEAASGEDLAFEFTGLEARLVGAEVVEMDFEIGATGAYPADLSGSLRISPDSGTTFVATGQFGGQPVDLFLRPHPEGMIYGNGDIRLVGVVPSDLQAALVIGLTRMGLLHNLARLSGVVPPDHMDGNVQSWVTVDGYRASTDHVGAVEFDLTVAGVPSGTASLLMDDEGLPVIRRQVVQFPDGEMHVVERYSNVVIQR